MLQITVNIITGWGLKVGNDDDDGDENMTAQTLRSSISSKRSSVGNY